MTTKTQKCVTVEAEYTHPGSTEATVHRWTFCDLPPEQAKDTVVSRYVPMDATLWWVGLWYGTADNRPAGGHESGILK